MPDPPTPARGLHHARSPLLRQLNPRRGLTRRRIAFQGVAAAIGIGMFAWAVALALAPANREQLAALVQAPPPLLALLTLLTAASILVNGVLFWIALNPLRRLPPLDVLAVNAIATFLSILPFKLNLLARVVIHHRRDALPFRDLVAWLAAVAALGLAALAPLAGASLWRGRLDAPWWAASLGGIAALGALGVALGRLSSRWRWLATTSLGAWRIVRHPVPVGASLAVRLVDVALLAARFLCVAAIIGLALSPAHAVILATLWFALSVAAPAGTLGYREGILVMVASPGLGAGSVATLALGVMGAELGVSALLAIAGAAWLRLDRLLAPSSAATGAPEELHHPDPAGR